MQRFVIGQSGQFFTDGIIQVDPRFGGAAINGFDAFAQQENGRVIRGGQDAFGLPNGVAVHIGQTVKTRFVFRFSGIKNRWHEFAPKRTLFIDVF